MYFSFTLKIFLPSTKLCIVDYYRPRMQRGNVFIVSVFLSVIVSIWAVTFEAEGIESFSLAQW